MFVQVLNGIEVNSFIKIVSANWVVHFTFNLAFLSLRALHPLVSRWSFVASLPFALKQSGTRSIKPICNLASNAILYLHVNSIHALPTGFTCWTNIVLFDLFVFERHVFDYKYCF